MMVIEKLECTKLEDHIKKMDEEYTLGEFYKYECKDNDNIIEMFISKNNVLEEVIIWDADRKSGYVVSMADLNKALKEAEYKIIKAGG